MGAKADPVRSPLCYPRVTCPLNSVGNGLKKRPIYAKKKKKKKNVIILIK